MPLPVPSRVVHMLSAVGLTLALGLAAAPAGIASAAASSITLASGTAPIGQPDPSVRVVAGAPVGPAPVFAHPAYTVIPGTNYVGFANGGPGSIVYETTFTVPDAAVAPSMTLSVRADNGFKIALNGAAPFTGEGYAYPNDPCGGSFYGPAYPSPVTFTVTSGFVRGPNTLTFTVDNCNTPGATGLDFLGTVSYTLDTTPPSIAGARSPAANANGWNNGPVTVSFTCADGESGVKTCPPSATISADGAGQSVTGTAIDNAGNAASATVGGINVDTTPPTVADAGNAGRYTVDQQVAITCEATDALSGIAATTCQNVSGPAYSFPLGSTTVTATATDKAGNVGTGTTTFTVVSTPEGVGALTVRFVQSSAAYAALTPAQRAAVDSRLGAILTRLPAALARLTPQQKAEAIAIYQRAVVELVPLGWLTADQAALLGRLAAAM